MSRELSRNTLTSKTYSAATAQQKYIKRREKCGRGKLLKNQALRSKAERLFLEQQWSPEQISQRLIIEKSSFRISHNTIYRTIYAGMFDTQSQKNSNGNRGAIRKLRHRGKTRRKNGTTETRGKIVISNTIHERPAEANSRKEIGHLGFLPD
jgi:IS30 family transposase